jgi:hypothetical protein
MNFKTEKIVTWKGYIVRIPRWWTEKELIEGDIYVERMNR